VNTLPWVVECGVDESTRLAKLAAAAAGKAAFPSISCRTW
jgi:hypothetical protein